VTLSMADSVTVAALPAGYDAYLGYVDGDYVTAPALKAAFPGKPLVLLTVTDTWPAGADGADVENGDLEVAQAGPWAARAISSGVARPVLYCSVGSMDELVAGLPVPRSSVRLLSAHYGAGEHICGPSTCGLVSTGMDGTQWTDAAAGNNGALIDASVLAGNFFTGGNPEMIILSVTENGVTTTYLYAPGQTPQHIVSGADQNAFAAVLPVVPVSPAQFALLDGQS
jgi:hypothetical protein